MTSLEQPAPGSAPVEPAPRRRRTDRPGAAATTRPPARRRRRLGRLPVVLGAWAALAIAAAVGRLAPRPPATPVTARVAADAPRTDPVAALDTMARHAPVFVRAEPMHAPVRVVAAPPPRPEPRTAAERFAAVVGRVRGGLRVAAGLAEPTVERPGLPKPFARIHAAPTLMPRLALPRVLRGELAARRGLKERARPGEPVQVMISAYCLQGTTRRGTRVRPGIVAADPHVFPLARHVELFSGGRYLGRFRVEDTGGAIRGTRIDIWTPDCADAQRFGLRPGIAALVALGDR